MKRSDLKKLADKLHGTSGNIFTIGKSMGLDVTDDTFGELENHEGIFKCLECGAWKTVGEVYYEGSEMCVECGREMDGEDEESDDGE